MLLLALILLLLAAVVWYFHTRPRYRVPLPPGPPGDPILGHLRFIPPNNPENTFQKWGETYGDVVHIRLLNRPVILLNSVKAATDLLEKRSANYSDRPTFTIYNLMGWGRSASFLRYGEDFRRHRRLMQDYLNNKKCIDYQPIQSKEARLLLRNLITDSKRRQEFIARYSTSIVMSIAYGHQIASDDDPYLQIAEGIGHAMANSGSPANTPVDFFPFLRYLPSWVPGTYYAKFARDHRVFIDALHTYPFDEVNRLLSEGKAQPSFLSHHIENINREGGRSWASFDDAIRVAGIMYGAGAETTWTTLTFFFLAMVLHPQCQDKAQEEIDAVVGLDRLPDFNDRPFLRYVEAILQETFRWRLVTPLGVPHKSMEDDIYKGMFIPKGSLIIANVKAMISDEHVYANPDEFDPARYLPEPNGRGEPYPNVQFGFGRRICPGRHLADATLWIAIASILATLRISKAIDEHKNEITPSTEVTSGIVNHPQPFECRIETRNARAHRLVVQTDTWDF